MHEFYHGNHARTWAASTKGCAPSGAAQRAWLCNVSRGPERPNLYDLDGRASTHAHAHLQPGLRFLKKSLREPLHVLRGCHGDNVNGLYREFGSGHAQMEMVKINTSDIKIELDIATTSKPRGQIRQQLRHISPCSAFRRWLAHRIWRRTHRACQ
jgi:hypothetical protein